MSNVIDTNPNPQLYVEIENYSAHFNKDFEGDYLYFILYYDDNGVHASNFMYWENIGGGFVLNTTPTTIEIIYSLGDAYNYYSTALGGGMFDYDAGHDSIAYKFTYDFNTGIVTLYNQDNSVRWTSPVGLGISTNAYAVTPQVGWTMTENGLVNPAIPAYQKVGAFANCTSLRRVSIPPTVKKIGDYAFYNTQISAVTIASDCEYADTSFPEGCVITYY